MSLPPFHINTAKWRYHFRWSQVIFLTPFLISAFVYQMPNNRPQLSKQMDWFNRRTHCSALSSAMWESHPMCNHNPFPFVKESLYQTSKFFQILLTWQLTSELRPFVSTRQFFSNPSHLTTHKWAETFVPSSFETAIQMAVSPLQPVLRRSSLFFLTLHKCSTFVA